MSIGARRLWSPEEDEQLRLLVSYWGDQCGKNGNWDKISANFEHRTAKDCRKRWFHSLDPKLKRGRWSDAEDKVLVDAFARLGPSWQRISQLIPGRTDDQCSKRYNDVLDPSAAERLRDWDAEEDAKLMELIEAYGTKWRDICKFMNGRTGLTCRNRWRKLRKLQEMKQDVDKQDINSGSRVIPHSQMHHQQHLQSEIHAPHAPHAPLVQPFHPPGSSGPEELQSAHSQVPNISADNATTYTISYDDPPNYENSIPGPNASEQCPISEQELTRILEFCRDNNQKIVIHQHIHQTIAAPPQSTMHASASSAPIPAPAPTPHYLQQQPPSSTIMPSRLTPGLDFGSPQSDNMFIGGSFANMDYMAFNPS